MLAAGLITLARTIPTIVTSFRESVKDFGSAGGGESRARTERDMPLNVVLGGLAAAGDLPGRRPGAPTQGNVLAAVLIVLFGFFFVTVSSRITGLIGNSSNPISGMTIATLILTCTIFVGARLDRRRLRADRARRRRGGVHRRRDRRSDVAGSQDRLHRRRDADLTSRSGS